MKILLIGKDGQVGRELARSLPSQGEVVMLGRSELDLADPRRIVDNLRSVSPHVVINAAAYTAVDRAESESDKAFAVNARGPEVLAQETARLDALLVHYSTDYVFDGRKTGPYVEDDAPNPLNVYGSSKLAGERAILASGCRHLVLRTSWVYGPHGANFMFTMLRLAKERPVLRVVDDQIGAPTSSVAIARATAQLVAQRATGLYHLSAAGKTSWCGFAREILSRAGMDTSVVAIRSEEYPAAARRPLNSLLDNARLHAAFGVRLAPWQEQLSEVMAMRPTR